MVVNVDKNEVKALYLAGLSRVAIAKKVGVSPETVGTWVKRGKWTQIRTRLDTVSAEIVPTVAPTVDQSLASRSSLIRTALSKIVEEQVSELRKLGETSPLGNTPDGEGRATILKKVTETAAIIHDWDSERAPGLIVIADMRASAPEELAPIQIASSSSYTPTGSSPEPVSTEPDTLESK